MIRLRQSLEAALRHPVLGPALLLVLAFVLAFMLLHTVEHGIDGLLVSCAMAVAIGLRLVVVVGRVSTPRPDPGSRVGRAPPPVARLLRRRSVVPVVLVPLRL